MFPELIVKNGPFRFQFHKTTGSPSKAKSPHKRAMGDNRRCIFRAKSSDLSVVKHPWNLSNAHTSAPISNNGGLVEQQGVLQRQFLGPGKKANPHINNSGEHDDEHGFTIRVIVDD
jgi:hypothetical protein